jgi:alanyl-tRNA synthetase
MTSQSNDQTVATRKLYWEDPYLKTFQAHLLSSRPVTLPTGICIKTPAGACQVALDQTAFYPEGGGQPSDHGKLNGIPVLYVFEDQGIIWHVVTEDPLEMLNIEQQVTGGIDWERRFDLMQQHLGQHILSAIFDTLDASTIGFHLGDQHVTIDLDKGPFSRDTLSSVEHRVNQIIFEDRPVLSTLISEEAYHAMVLRKTPDISDQVRMIEVKDTDICACSGTHPHTTGTVGLLKITKSETYKGGCRITFLCGSRALKAFDSLLQEANQAAGTLSVGWPELAASVHSLRLENKQLSKELKDVQQDWALLERHHLLAEAEVVQEIPVVLVCDEAMNFKRLSFLANAFRSQPDVVVFLGATFPEPRFILLNNTKIEGLSMQQLMKESIHLIDGKGGGNASSAQGGGRKPEGLESMLREIKASTAKIITESAT